MISDLALKAIHAVWAPCGAPRGVSPHFQCLLERKLDTPPSFLHKFPQKILHCDRIVVAFDMMVLDIWKDTTNFVL